jgi:hypothetical protein
METRLVSPDGKVRLDAIGHDRVKVTFRDSNVVITVTRAEIRSLFYALLPLHEKLEDVSDALARM